MQLLSIRSPLRERNCSLWCRCRVRRRCCCHSSEPGPLTITSRGAYLCTTNLAAEYLRRIHMVKPASTFVLIPILTVATALGCSSNGAIPTQDSTVRSQQAAVTSDAGAVSATAASVTSATDAGVSATELARIQAYLDTRYTAKDVWRTFETKLGQTIDCIDWFAQPSVK